MLEQFDHERAIVGILLEASGKKIPTKPTANNFKVKKKRSRNSLGNEIVVCLRPIGRPVECRRWIAHNLEHCTRRMHLGKGRDAIAKFDRSYANCPHIDPIAVHFVCVVCGRIDEHFGRHVIRRSNACAPFAHGTSCRRRQSEIAHFHLALGRQQNIARLNVAVHKVILVQMDGGGHRFAQNVRDMIFGWTPIERMQLGNEIFGRATFAILKSGGEIGANVHRRRQSIATQSLTSRTSHTSSGCPARFAR